MTTLNKKADPPTSYTELLFRSLTVNHLPPTTTSWLASVLYALDSKDVDAYCSFMSPTVTVTFNNGEHHESLGPNMRGIDAVRGGLAAFWQGFKSIRHEELAVLGSERLVVHEALNHYETWDGRQLTVRAVAVLERDAQGRIEGVRVYGDQSPVWSA